MRMPLPSFRSLPAPSVSPWAPADSDAFEMCDVTYSVDHWAMLAGQPLASMGRITITEQEMLPVRRAASLSAFVSS